MILTREILRKMIYEAINEDQPFSSVAVIGGAFKPPHLGHVAMVDHYSSLADAVKIYISDPKSERSQRFGVEKGDHPCRGNQNRCHPRLGFPQKQKA